MMKKITYSKIVVAFGFLLSLVQFISNRSLWIDEAMLARNIISKSSAELLQPLDYMQVAPILFLQIEKFSSSMMPDSELGLRIFPLIFYWFSLILFYKIISLVFSDRWIILLLLSLFVLNNHLIYYSSEVKQYASDVAFTLSIYYFSIKKYIDDSKKYIYISFLGAIGVFLSNISPVILTCAGLYLLLQNAKERNNLKAQHLFFTLLIWIAVFLLYYIRFIKNHPSQNRMIKYWENVGAFIPNNPFSADFYAFLSTNTSKISSALLPFSEIGATLIILFLFLGIVSLIKNGRKGFIILFLLPPVIHLLLSAFRLYPFDLRLILYIFPLLIFVIGFGLQATTGLLSDKGSNIIKISFVLMYLSGAFFYYKDRFPIKNEEIKDSLIYIQENKRPEEKIYVYYGARHAFLYYQEMKFIKQPIEVVMGALNRENKSKYVEELEAFKGRSWILFAHPYRDEESFILSKLDSLGFARLQSFTTQGSSAYLYDFED
jgi:hypothetical protein